jgi:hypothetical protein
MQNKLINEIGMWVLCCVLAYLLRHSDSYGSYIAFAGAIVLPVFILLKYLDQRCRR